MTVRRNNFAGQTINSTVTTGNSAASGAPFTTVSPGTGTITYVADPASGSRIAIRLTPGGDSSCYVRDANFNDPQISLSDCFYYSGPPSGDAPVHQVTVGATSCASICITAAGFVRIKGVAGATLATATAALTAGHWYRFETQILSDASAGTVACQWYIDDGATQTGSLSVSGRNTRGGAITNVDRGTADSAAAGYLANWYYSNLQAKDGTTTALGAFPTYAANAGPDQSGVEPYVTVTLDASGSSGASTYAWTQTGGTAVTLAGATTAHPTFTAPATLNGDSLVFTLVVNGNSDPDTVTVSVAPHTCWVIDRPAGSPTVGSPVRITLI